MKHSTRTRLRRWLIILAVLAVGLPGGYYLARQQLWPAYKNWRHARLDRMAEKFLAAHDYDNALLTARQSLMDDRRNLNAWRIAAEAARAKGVIDVIYYQQNLAHIDKTLASRIALIRDAIHFGDYRDALDAVEGADASAKDSAEFHELAAQVYLHVNRPIPAKLHLYSLISLRPNDQVAKLDLAEIQLADETDRNSPKLREEVLALSRTPALHIRALALLLKDAITRSDKARALELADQLRGENGLTGEQKVLVLSGLALGAPDRADAYRHELQREFATDPEAAVALIHYYRGAGPRIEARRWFDSLPRATAGNVAVQEAIAGDFLEWQEWVRLDQAINGAQWKDREFMRHAFAAYSARKNVRMADAGNEWRLAVIQAGDNARNTAELLALVARWGWQTEQYDLVWKLFALMPRNESISQQLIAWERYQGHTANLNRIFARLVEFGDADAVVKNNFAYTSLLLDANVSKACEFAKANYQADPNNPFFVTTEAFALYKQNHPKEALALFETMSPAEKVTPERVLLRAVLRATTGDAAGAADLLSGLKPASFLPEERELITHASEEVARLDRERGQDLKLLALKDRGEIDRAKGWMRALPENVRATANVEMQTADELFAIGDLAGLGTQLRKGAWGEQDHLRYELIAYVERARGAEGTAKSYWRSALGAAGDDPQKLEQLGDLAALWNWREEKMEVLARMFARDPSDRGQFTELMNYYRANGRTADLVAVLEAYTSAHPGDAAQTCELAYYSLLSGLHIANAYVSARASYDAAPHDPTRQFVYAFSLWKQGRAKEAWDVMRADTETTAGFVPAGLLRAAILTDLQRRDEALQALKSFDPSKALPEEAKLATLLASRLRRDVRVSGV